MLGSGDRLGSKDGSGDSDGSAEGDTDGEGDTEGEGDTDGDGDTDGEGETFPVIWSVPPLQVEGILSGAYQPTAVWKHFSPASLPLSRQKVCCSTLSLRTQLPLPDQS